MSARATHVLQYEQLLNMKLFHMNAEYQFSFKKLFNINCSLSYKTPVVSLMEVLR